MQHKTAQDSMRASGAAVIAVDDTLSAMQKVAELIRSRYPIPVIGVTGSVGKTTTREMIYTALKSRFKAFQTVRNYNSQVGVPLTLAKLDASYEIAVLEMGMSNYGEMERLAQMIRPDTAVMTCIGVAHIEQLKTQEHICDEKSKIAMYMKASDTIYCNGDDPVLRARHSKLVPNVVWYGMAKDCDYRADNLHMDKGESVFTAHTPKQACEVRLQALGEHNVRNALVAIAVAEQYGIDARDAAKALYTFQGQRQKVIQTPYFTMIDDTYNASPDSMKASLYVLRDMPCKGRRIAVLADMLELGEREVEYHEQVGAYVKEAGVDYLIVYGALAKHIAKTAGIACYQATSAADVAAHLKQYAKPEDCVLLKGSNGMKLSAVVSQFS
jgi:UDP-N-acetylmuramoyl-tripeptide--D-alanyl-D-alanine ligase